LEEYAVLNVWQINPQTFNIRFIDAWHVLLLPLSAAIP
jgi:hypothetical protein